MDTDPHPIPEEQTPRDATSSPVERMRDIIMDAQKLYKATRAHPQGGLQAFVDDMNEVVDDRAGGVGLGYFQIIREDSTPPARLGKLLTEYDVAALLSVSIHTVRKWRSRKTGPPYCKIGRSVRYPQGGLHEFIDDRYCQENAK